VCHFLHYQNRCSCNCFVTSVTDISGDLRIWLDIDVIASDQDTQKGAVTVFLYVLSVIKRLGDARICQGTVLKHAKDGEHRLIL